MKMANVPDLQMLRAIVELPTLIFLVIIVGVVLRFRARRTGTALITGAGILLYAVATPYAGRALLRTLEQSPTPAELGRNVPAISPPQAIVVLSANARTTRQNKVEAGPLTLERLLQGARLHRDTGLPILVSGGPSGDIPGSLSAVMAGTLAEDFRLGPVWQENRSRTTAENARFSSEILTAKGVASIYLVTHAWHMPRALSAFRSTGLDVRTWPVELPRPTGKTGLLSFLPSASGLQASQYATHEWIGQIWYKLTEY